MEIFIIIGLTLLNGIFSMSEMSLVSARKFKLEAEKKKGNKGAKTALDLSDNPTRFFSTVQIGITLIGILLGVYSGENLTKGVESFLAQFKLIEAYAHNIAVAAIVIFVTYISIVFGELFPKRLGLTFPEPIAILLSRPMLILSKVTSPFVWLLTSSNDLLLKIFGIKKSMEGSVSEEEIKSIIKDSADGGEIQEIEQNIVERVFELGDRKAKSLITHKGDIVYFNISDSFEVISNKINEEKHSAYPVCVDNDINHIIGLVLIKDLFSPDFRNDFELKKILKAPLFITENTFAYNFLELFKNKKMHYAIVLDEYGSTKGIITMDDVLDALVGDVSEHNQSEYQIVQRDENSWLVDAQFPIVEFEKQFQIKIQDTKESFVTVAGFFIHQFHAIPNLGDTIEIKEGFRLEIIDKDEQRIDKILLTKI